MIHKVKKKENKQGRKKKTDSGQDVITIALAERGLKVIFVLYWRGKVEVRCNEEKGVGH